MLATVHGTTINGEKKLHFLVTLEAFILLFYSDICENRLYLLFPTTSWMPKENLCSRYLGKVGYFSIPLGFSNITVKLSILKEIFQLKFRSHQNAYFPFFEISPRQFSFSFLLKKLVIIYECAYKL